MPFVNCLLLNACRCQFVVVLLNILERQSWKSYVLELLAFASLEKELFVLEFISQFYAMHNIFNKQWFLLKIIEKEIFIKYGRESFSECVELHVAEKWKFIMWKFKYYVKFGRAWLGCLLSHEMAVVQISVLFECSV